MVKQLVFFELHGKILAEDENEARMLLENLLNKKIIDTFKIESLMVEARR